MVRVIRCKIGQDPEVTWMDTSLDSLQEYVGGWIELVYPFEKENIALVCNEEGKLMDLDPSVVLLDVHSGDINDIILGNCLFMAFNEEGETTNLTTSQINYIMSDDAWAVVPKGWCK